MRRLISAFREAGIRFSRDGCAFHAQSVAFNALFAIFPLMVLALSAATLVFPNPERRLLMLVGTLAPTVQDYVSENLQTYIYGRGISSLIAFAFLLWSGKNLFMGLAYALDRALNVPKSRPLVHNLLLSVVMLPATAVLLLIAIALPVVLAVTFRIAGIGDPQRVTHLLGYLISIALVYIVAVAALPASSESPDIVGLRGARRRHRGDCLAGGAVRVRRLRDARQLHANLRCALCAARSAALVLLHRLDLSLRRRV